MGKHMLKWFDPTEPIGALLLAGVFVAVGLLLSHVVRQVIKAALRYDQSERIDQITLSFLSRLAVLVLWLLLLAAYAHLVPVLDRLGTTLLAGVSLVSIIVGFAAQSTLSNLVAGISLVLYKPFRRGDRIQIAAPSTSGHEVATVEDISLGYTVLRTDDQRQIIVANGTMAQQTMIRLPAAAAAAPGPAPAPGDGSVS